MKQLLSLIVSISLFWLPFSTTAITLKKGHPVQYEVKPGDTLWDIAGKFLYDPLEWPLLLQTNPDITDPHKIYPGEILELSLVNGHPALYVRSGGTIKLSPSVRSEALDDAIPAIPYSVIAPFINFARVVDPESMEQAPYVVAQARDRTIVGAGEYTYIENLLQPGQELVDSEKNYSLFRLGQPYVDPETKKVLGYEGLHIGDIIVTRAGNPATALLVSTTREVLVGDRALPYEGIATLINYELTLPPESTDGQIISVFNGAVLVGLHQVVAINRGTKHGLQPGNVLAVFHRGKTIENPIKSNKQATVELPNERAGQMIVFRTFEQVSYGLIMAATRPMHLLDIVKSPQSS